MASTDLWQETQPTRIDQQCSLCGEDMHLIGYLDGRAIIACRSKKPHYRETVREKLNG